MVRETYNRWQGAGIERALRTRRVVLLEGPRQSGKTTLSRTFASADAVYRTLDDQSMLDLARDDPAGFVRHGDGLMVIDEVQLAPGLLPAIKLDVDGNQKYGRYLLTGSVHVQSLPTVRESLAGRIRKQRLRPLAMGEIHGRPPGFVANAFNGEFGIPEAPDGRALDKEGYIALAMEGGFPEALRAGDAGERRKWFEDYLAALVDRDLRDPARISRRDGLVKLVEALAAWSSKEVDITKIGSATPVSRPTVESYMNALEALYVVERVRPWHTNDYNRAIRRDKVFMADSGFMSSILKWRPEAVRLDGDLNGKLIETFVFNQLAAILDAQEDRYELHHYRDRDGREIDLLVEDADGNLLALEVKAGPLVNRSMFKHMDWFKRNLARNRGFKGVVLYSGELVVSYDDDMWAVPICSMWA